MLTPIGVGMKAEKRKNRIYCRFVKRALDIILSVMLLIFLWLPMLFIAVVIRSESRGGAIFRQKRVGRGGRVFVCYKFRSMHITTPQKSATELGDPGKYITRVGGFLRRSSLDELPQLYNVLKGDMSLIGPRPLICEEKDIHRERMDRGVYSLRPGMTGMAQVSGRNTLADGEKLDRDEYYLENVRLALDVKILLKTVLKVFSGEGVSVKDKSAEP